MKRHTLFFCRLIRVTNDKPPPTLALTVSVTRSVSRSLSYSPSALQRKKRLCIPRKGFERPQSQFPHSCVGEGFIYSWDRSTYFPAAE
jgi:hypothetical protein